MGSNEICTECNKRISRPSDNFIDPYIACVCWQPQIQQRIKKNIMTNIRHSPQTRHDVVTSWLIGEGQSSISRRLHIPLRTVQEMAHHYRITGSIDIIPRPRPLHRLETVLLPKPIHTHCKNGHPFTEDNIYYIISKHRNRAVRRCKICTKALAHLLYKKCYRQKEPFPIIQEERIFYYE